MSIPKDPRLASKRQPSNARATERPFSVVEPGDVKAPKPTIVTTGETLSNVTERAIAALAGANEPPRLFRSGGALARIEHDEHDLPVIRPARMPEVRYELDLAANWQTVTREGERKPTTPKREIVENVLATPFDLLPFPPLRGVVSAPFYSNGGTLAVETGYVPTARVYLDLEPGLDVPAIGRAPEDVRAAVALIDDEVLIDFPLADDASRAHAFALLILPFVREMIDGPTPLHMVEAPAAGSGKTLLAKTLLLPGVGNVTTAALVREEPEVRKLVTSIFQAGRTAVMFDNLTGKVDSGTLSHALTSWPHWGDRLLGSSTSATFDARTIWVATQNNANVSTEISRRSVTIRLDVGLERPEERDGFHFRLPEHVKQNRGRFIGAALTIVAGWIAKGKPSPTKLRHSLGSYEEYVRVVGGILEAAGVAGFLEDRERVMAEADSESADWRRFVGAWHEAFGTTETTAAGLLPCAETAGFDLGTDDVKNGAKRLGRRLAAKKDAVFCGFRIVRVPHKNSADGWRLQPPKNRPSDPKGTLEGAYGVFGGISATRHACEKQTHTHIEPLEHIPPNTPNTPFAGSDDVLEPPDEGELL